MFKLFLILLLFSSNAFAQVQDGSKSMEFLSAIYGSLFGYDYGGNPLQEFVKAFNYICLIFAASIISYKFYMEILSTADEGQSLFKGKLAIVPVKIAIVVVLIFPIHNGYSAGQYLVAKTIKLSVEMADMAWGKFMETLPENTPISLSKVETKDLTFGLLDTQICMKTLQSLKDNDKDNLLGYGNLKLGTTTYNDNGKTYIQFGSKERTAKITTNTCGTVSYNNSAPVIELSSKGIGEAFRSKKTEELAIQRANAISKGQEQALKVLISDLDFMATKIINTEKVNYDEIIELSLKYEKALKEVASKEVINTDLYSSVKANATNDGWLGALSFYSVMNNFQDTVSRSMADIPKVNVSILGANSNVNDIASINYLKFKNILAEKNKSANYGISYQLGGSKNKNTNIDDSALGEDEIQEKLREKLPLNFENFVVAKNENIINALHRFGLNLIEMFGMAFAFFAATSIFSAIVSLNSVAIMFLPMALAMLSGGILLAYVIPTMPLLVMLGTVISWLIQVIGSIFIYPLIVIMALIGDDKSYLSNSTRGHQFIVTLFFKPFLITLGFIISYILIQVIGSFLTHIFWDSYIQSALHDTGYFTGFFGLVIGLFMYGAIMIITIYGVLRSMITIPDYILENVFQTSSTQSQIAGNYDGTSGKFAGMAGAGAVAGAVNGVANGVSSFANNFKNGIGNKLKENTSLTAMDKKVTDAIKNSNLTQKEKEEQASNYASLRNHFAQNPNDLKEASKFNNMADFGKISSINTIGKEFKDLDLSGKGKGDNSSGSESKGSTSSNSSNETVGSSSRTFSQKGNGTFDFTNDNGGVKDFTQPEKMLNTGSNSGSNSGLSDVSFENLNKSKFTQLDNKNIDKSNSYEGNVNQGGKELNTNMDNAKIQTNKANNAGISSNEKVIDDVKVFEKTNKSINTNLDPSGTSKKEE